MTATGWHTRAEGSSPMVTDSGNYLLKRRQEASFQPQPRGFELREGTSVSPPK